MTDADYEFQHPGTEGQVPIDPDAVMPEPSLLQQIEEAISQPIADEIYDLKIPGRPIVLKMDTRVNHHRLQSLRKASFDESLAQIDELKLASLVLVEYNQAIVIKGKTLTAPSTSKAVTLADKVVWEATGAISPTAGLRKWFERDGEIVSSFWSYMEKAGYGKNDEEPENPINASSID